MSKVLLNIGYQGRSLAGLCEAVSASGAVRLLDVRDRAWSQRPEFRKGVLRTALEAQGVAYVHFKAAGNPTRPKAGTKADVAECESAYREHLRSRPEVLPALLAEMKSGPVALFCFERGRHECHRGVLIGELLKLDPGIEIIDL